MIRLCWKYKGCYKKMINGSMMSIGLLASGGITRNRLDLFFAVITFLLGEIFFVESPIPRDDYSKTV